MSTRHRIIAAVIVTAVAGILLVRGIGPAQPVKITAQEMPPSLRLNGLIRDFAPEHPDFALSAGTAHVAGNVATALDASGSPVYTGSGFVVSTQWRDSQGRHIAPSRYNQWGTVSGICYMRPGVGTDGALLLNNQAYIDSFDSTVGRYGGANVGSEAIIATNSTAPATLMNANSSDVLGDAFVGPGGDPAVVYVIQPGSTLSGTVDVLPREIPMPTITVPTGLGVATDLLVNSGATVEITTNRHFRRFVVDRGGNVRIRGHVTILCEEEFRVRGASLTDEFGEVEIMPNSSLTMYLRGPSNMIAGEFNHNTGNPALCSISVVGGGTIALNNPRAKLVAHVFAPGGELQVEQGAQLYGSYTGGRISVDNQGMIHVDTAWMRDYEPPLDQAGAAGSSHLGFVDAASSFDQWFREDLGTSLSAAHTITLPMDDNGVYEFETDSFYPVDDQLLGNDSGSHNTLFTYEIRATFRFIECGAQFIEFEGDGDAWIFINDQLAMDLGGVRPGQTQYVEVERFGLAPGSVNTLNFLHARRQTSDAGFHMRTNILLETLPVTPSGGFD